MIFYQINHLKQSIHLRCPFVDFLPVAVGRSQPKGGTQGRQKSSLRGQRMTTFKKKKWCDPTDEHCLLTLRESYFPVRQNQSTRLIYLADPMHIQRKLTNNDKCKFFFKQSKEASIQTLSHLACCFATRMSLCWLFWKSHHLWPVIMVSHNVYWTVST